jgi:hypothetical protein
MGSGIPRVIFRGRPDTGYGCRGMDRRCGALRIVTP